MNANTLYYNMKNMSSSLSGETYASLIKKAMVKLSTSLNTKKEVDQYYKGEMERINYKMKAFEKEKKTAAAAEKFIEKARIAEDKAEEKARKAEYKAARKASAMKYNVAKKPKKNGGYMDEDY